MPNDIYKLITELANKLPLEFNHRKETFYEFAQKELDEYVTVLNNTQKDVIESMLRESECMKGNATKRRFVNLISDINCQCLNILARSYYGDIKTAICGLEKLLTTETATINKLDDILANYFLLSYNKLDTSFYRARDEEKAVKDCWNVPFDCRQKASRGRFNQTGTISMYLSNSEELCSIELGAPEKYKKRWIQCFKFSKEVILLDLTIPTNDEIQRMDIYRQFSFLLLYPFYILCLTKGEHDNSDNFIEEYLFSQLMFHLLFMQKNDSLPYYQGIIYSSVKHKDGINVVLPSLYKVPENNNRNKKSKNINELITPIGTPKQIRQ